MQKSVTNYRGTTKYIHDSGAETTIKTGISQEYQSSGDILTENRNKYSIIISSSIGCQMGCKFCGLEDADIPFKNLHGSKIVLNILEAIRLHDKSELEDKYVKLCFMGMGDCAMSSKRAVIRFLSKKLVSEGFAIGIDSIDFGTILPKGMDKDFMDEALELDFWLRDTFEINPANNHGSVVRIFFSAHSFMVVPRIVMMPQAATWDLHEMIHETKERGLDVILHYAFMEGANDSLYDIACIKRYMRKCPEIQLRMLRFNDTKTHRESPNYLELWEELEDLPNIKYQVSPGKDIHSACGMFGS